MSYLIIGLVIAVIWARYMPKWIADYQEDKPRPYLAPKSRRERIRDFWLVLFFWPAALLFGAWHLGFKIARRVLKKLHDLILLGLEDKQ